MKTNVVARVTAVAAIAGLLAGCGYSFPADTPNPCTLITPEQLQEILILQFKDGAPKPDYSNDHQNVCQWNRTDAEGEFIQVLVATNVERFEAEREEVDGGTGVTAAHTVPDADEAYYALGGSLIAFTVDGYFVNIANYTAAPGPRLETTTEVAGIIAGNVRAASGDS